MQVPTIKIKCPENERAGYAIINEADFDPALHERFEEAAAEPEGAAEAGVEITVKKGPGGRFYGFQGDRRVTTGYPTEEALRAFLQPVN